MRDVLVDSACQGVKDVGATLVRVKRADGYWEPGRL